MKKNKNKNKYARILIVLLLIIIIAIIILHSFIKTEEKPNIVVSKATAYTYSAYQENCTKNDTYFEEIAKLMGGINYSLVKQAKQNSTYCVYSETSSITEEEVENMTCSCVERNLKSCPEGYTLSEHQEFCIKGESVTSLLKSCSAYKCENNLYVERT